MAPARPGTTHAGSVYGVGFVNAGGTDNAMAVARVDPNGNLDPTFDIDGVAVRNVVTGPFAPGEGGAPAPTGSGETARGVGVQTDGKIVIAGQAETATTPAPFDSRDTDIYVSRFNTDGTSDATFAAAGGTPGTLRINLSNGDSTGTTILGDNAWDLKVLADDSIVLSAARGADIVARPGKLDRDYGVAKLTPNGTLDGSFGNTDINVPADGDSTDGVALANELAPDGSGRSFSENLRGVSVQPDGKLLVAGYGGLEDTDATPGIDNSLGVRPIISRFNTNGTLDATFGGDGIASAEVLGPKPPNAPAGQAPFAEAYAAAVQSDGRVVGAGYGNRNIAGSSIDQVTYRFTATGTFDPTFGTNGATVYDRGVGLEDRARHVVVLPNDRILIAGSTAPNAVSGTPQLNGLLYMLLPNGTPDASFGAAGAISVNLGGPADALFGLALLPGGQKAVAAGYRGFGGAAITGDEAAMVRIDLSPGATGPTGPTGSTGGTGSNGSNGSNGNDGAPGAGGPGGPGGPAGPAGSRGATGPRGPAAGVRVSCRLVRTRSGRRIRCTTRQTASASGTVRVRLARAGRVVATGRGRVRGGRATITLSGRPRSGAFTLTAMLPTRSGQHRRASQKVVVG